MTSLRRRGARVRRDGVRAVTGTRAPSGLDLLLLVLAGVTGNN
jgi:hypothetical protein